MIVFPIGTPSTSKYSGNSFLSAADHFADPCMCTLFSYADCNALYRLSVLNLTQSVVNRMAHHQLDL